MDIILLEKVRNLGDLGARVNVRAGYGRNYLIPQGIAVPATAKNLSQFEARRAEFEKKAQASLEQAQTRATALEQLQVKITANASDEGKLYGSIGPLELARAMSDAGQAVEKKEVLMPQGALHNVGSYTIDVQLHSDVMGSVQVEIEAAK